MIINTAIIFLRDLLPIFILFTYLAILFKGKKLNLSFWIYATLLGIFLAIFFFAFAEFISDWFEGAGLEVSYAILLTIVYVSFILLKLPKFDQQPSGKTFHVLALLGIAAFIALKGTEFLIFFNVHGHQQENLYRIVVGCIVGVGICISFSALFSFILREVRETHFAWTFTLLWYCFLAGQFSQITAFLSQVDIIDLGPRIINLTSVIEDSSEYGQILHALIGYESAPTLGFIIAYLLAVLIPLAADLGIKAFKGQAVKKEVTYE